MVKDLDEAMYILSFLDDGPVEDLAIHCAKLELMNKCHFISFAVHASHIYIQKVFIFLITACADTKIYLIY